MSEISTSDLASAESEKPVIADDVKLPPFLGTIFNKFCLQWINSQFVTFVLYCLPTLSDPTDNDFDEDITDEEKSHYKIIFPGTTIIIILNWLNKSPFIFAVSENVGLKMTYLLVIFRFKQCCFYEAALHCL